MSARKQKLLSQPSARKKKSHHVALETLAEFQDAADVEECAGGKHRVGDPVKSARAFVRALDVYDQGLQKHPISFDLAYNKARLQLEISQQPALIEHIGLKLTDWLQTTLQSHRYALRLSENNADVLFNTAQVLASIAEQLSEHGQNAEAAALLREALELLSSCLSRQEVMFEQHRRDFLDVEEDGGVDLPADLAPVPSTDVAMSEEQLATVEIPVTPIDLLDTIHASLSALTTLVPLVSDSDLQTLGDLACTLTESKAPEYIHLLRAEEIAKARCSVAVDRAIFVATLANAQFEARLIEHQAYLDRLETFDIAGKEQVSVASCAEAEARTEFVLSVLDRFSQSSELPAMLCWKQLSISQDLYTSATKIPADDAQQRKAEIYQAKGDIELFRHRIATLPTGDLPEGIQKSAQTLVQNAQTYYKGALSLAQAVAGKDDVEKESRTRVMLAKQISALLYGDERLGVADDALLANHFDDYVDQGLISAQLAQALAQSKPLYASTG